ncbi:MAG: AAA family ATPase [Mycobacteriales bacterium]
MLLEREAVLAEMAVLLTGVRDDGVGRFAVVEGVPGIGKTEVLNEVAVLAAATGMKVITSTAGEMEGDLPFGVARQLLVDDVTGHSSGPASAALGVGVVTGRVEVRRAEAHALTDLFELCRSMAAAGPLAVVVDDSHWADAASLKFLLYLARRLRGVPVALVVALRPANIAARRAELDQLVARADLTFHLQALSAAATSAVVRGWFGEPPSTSFTKVCVETTGGNPLLLRQLLEEAAAGGLQPTDADAARLRDLGSITVARSALLRVSRLGAAGVDIAATAALLGTRADLPLVASIAGVGAEEAELVVDGLVDAHLLKPGQPLRFVHPLVRSAIYRHMPRGLRSRRHREAARLLALAGAPEDEIGRHLLWTEPAGDEWVRQQLIAAGTRALAAGAPDVAVSTLRRALDEQPSAPSANLLLQLGQAEALVRDPAAYSHLMQAFTTGAAAVDQALAALTLVRLLSSRRRYSEAMDLLDRVLDRVGELDAETTLRIRAERLWLLDVTDVPAAAFVSEAQEVARNLSGSTHGERLALGHLATAELFQCAPHTRVRDLAQRALAGGSLLREEGPESPSWLYTASLLWVVGEYVAAERELLCGEQVAYERGAESPLVSIRAVRAWIAFELGELDRAADLARSALVRIRGNVGAGGRYARCCLITVLLERGQTQEAQAALDLITVQPDRRLDRFDALLLHARGELRLAQHDIRGIDDLLAVGRWCDERGIDNPGEWSWRSDVAPALADAGDRELATQLVTQEVSRARRFGVARPLGRALHAAGLVAGPEERIALLRESVQVLRDSPARLCSAKAQLHFGVALRAAGRVGEAQEEFRQALALATACHAEPLAADAHRLLLSTGARPRRRAVSGPGSLTPTEREVAALAAQGLSNREIATRLYVSVKAVEKHLRNTYLKLHVERRGALSKALQDEPAQAG